MKSAVLPTVGASEKHLNGNYRDHFRKIYSLNVIRTKSKIHKRVKGRDERIRDHLAMDATGRYIPYLFNYHKYIHSKQRFPCKQKMTLDRPQKNTHWANTG